MSIFMQTRTWCAVVTNNENNLAKLLKLVGLIIVIQWNTTNKFLNQQIENLLHIEKLRRVTFCAVSNVSFRII